jgi:hypothetical protein
VGEREKGVCFVVVAGAEGQDRQAFARPEAVPSLEARAVIGCFMIQDVSLRKQGLLLVASTPRGFCPVPQQLLMFLNVIPLGH